MDETIDTDALRREFADYCVEVEPGIKARAPKLNQLETLAIIAMTLFQACKELKAEKAEQAARITALESERDALLAAAGKEAVAIYQAGWPTPETVWGDVPKDAYDNYAQLAYTRRRIVYALPPSQLDTRWIDVNDRLPEIDYSKPAFDRAVVVLASWGGDKVAEMRYVSHGYAKREKGRAPRFEWQGRISPWLVTHWIPLPEAPANQKQADK